MALTGTITRKYPRWAGAGTSLVTLGRGSVAGPVRVSRRFVPVAVGRGSLSPLAMHRLRRALASPVQGRGTLVAPAMHRLRRSILAAAAGTGATTGPARVMRRFVPLATGSGVSAIPTGTRCQAELTWADGSAAHYVDGTTPITTYR